MADRYKEVLDAVCQEETDKTIYSPLVREFVTLEERLDYLRTLPFIQVHPKDPAKQRATAAHKQYKELLQQYSNIAKILGKIGGLDSQDDDSPLRSWAKNRAEFDDY